jgi:hypothetical protein
VPPRCCSDRDHVGLVRPTSRVANVKASAFAEVCADEDPDRMAAVVSYQRQHGGVSRRVKFAHFETAIFGGARARLGSRISRGASPPSPTGGC